MAPPRQVLREQLEILVDFMEGNKEFVKGSSSCSSIDNQRVRQKWAEVAKKLNSVESGALKTPERWKKYWFEWSYKSRKKAADARRFQSGPNRFVPLNDLEIRVLGLRRKSSAATDSSSKEMDSFMAEDSDSDPLENVKVQSTPVKKTRPWKSAKNVSRTTENNQGLSDDDHRSSTPPPKWALEIEERRIAAEERMATALEAMASVMQSQEKRRTMLDERLANAVTSIAGTVQDLNNGVQEALHRLRQVNPVQNGPDMKGIFLL